MRTNGNVKIFEIFGETQLKFVKSSKTINIEEWFPSGREVEENCVQNSCVFGQKMKIILIFLIKISMENWLFHIFTNYFLDFWPLSENLYLCNIRPDFNINFSYLGGTSGRSQPPTLLLLLNDEEKEWKMIKKD